MLALPSSGWAGSGFPPEGNRFASYPSRVPPRGDRRPERQIEEGVAADEGVPAEPPVIALRMVPVPVEPAGLRPPARRADDEIGEERDVPELDEIGVEDVGAVARLDLLAQD